MTPNVAMQEILTEVETTTGYAVTIQDDPSLPVLATVKAAKPGMPFTLIRVRPDTASTREYVISCQCLLVLRQALLPDGKQWEVSVSQKGRTELERTVRKSAAGKLGQAACNAFVENMLGGLVTQLRSVPIGLRVDGWIKEHFPVLAHQQRESAEQQLSDNLAVLSPNIRRMAPEEVYKASAGMNAAVAVYWASEWGDNTKATPYKVSGLMDSADALLRRFREIPENPESDGLLIDSWAAELGIAGWYELIPR